ncbi:MAG: 4-hydroxy-tetrahydrodipicolinate reductase, partial [Firmicutes bacterium]|nr:4-hydroxy-tetrahydrodipicolinate reductase [Bacillota bacterium]
MTNSIICGAGGKMGKVVFEIAKNIQNVKIVGGVDKFAEAKNFSFPLFPDFAKCDVPFDVVIDFSHPDALDDILNFCIKNKRGVVLSTTGYNETQKQKIKNAATKIAVFQSFNMSLGINLLCNLVNQAAKFLKDDY